MIKLAISGSLGRMGQRITHLALEEGGFKIVSLLEHSAHPELGKEVFDIGVSDDLSTLKKAHVLIEFTSPDATIEHLNYCVKNKVKMVIGTTGLTPEHIKKIKAASKKIAIVFSSNMSVGVNVIFKLAFEAAQQLSDYKIKVIEAHHIHKKDAPSGTAKTIAEELQKGAKKKITDIESIREGEIIGDHEMIFESDVDVIKISHSAKTRDIFAKGSLVAAKFLAKKKTGLFNMQEVLGLK